MRRTTMMNRFHGLVALEAARHRTGSRAHAALVLLLLVGACSQRDLPAVGRDDARPSLLVVVVVDQLGSALLEDQADALVGGLATLVREGIYVPRADVGYALTNSAPGHATAVTGAFPSRHGIVDNGWMERGEDGAWSYRSSSSDPNHSLIGTPDTEEGRSSHRRRVPTLGDWARVQDPRAAAVSIGQGPTSANSMASESGGTALWFSSDANGFVTSTYYADALPDWVAAFNRDVLPGLQNDSVWAPSPPPGAAPGPGPETRVHRFVDEPSAYPSWFQGTPFMDEVILRLARESVLRLELGARGTVDVLTINLSSLDEAGHEHGGASVERLDALHRLDRALGDFVGFLDQEVGPGGWALALTGDHGVAPSPEGERGVAPGAQRVGLDELRDLFQELEDALGQAPAGVRTEVARAVLGEKSYVRRVYSIDELSRADRTEVGFLGDYARSFHSGRVLDWPLYDLRGDLSLASLGIAAVQLTEGSIVDFAVGVHGSPYGYDRHVPLLFWAPGRLTAEVISGAETVGLVDLAPTLAGLAGLAVPPDVDGRDLGSRNMP